MHVKWIDIFVWYDILLCQKEDPPILIILQIILNLCLTFNLSVFQLAINGHWALLLAGFNSRERSRLRTPCIQESYTTYEAQWRTQGFCLRGANANNKFWFLGQIEDFYVNSEGGPMIFIGFSEAHHSLTGAIAPTCLYLGPLLVTRVSYPSHFVDSSSYGVGFLFPFV